MTRYAPGHARGCCALGDDGPDRPGAEATRDGGAILEHLAEQRPAVRRVDAGAADPRADALHGGRAEVADVPAGVLIRLAAAHRHGAAAVDLALHVGNVQRFGFTDPQQRIRHDRDDCRIAAPGEIGAAVRCDAGGEIRAAPIETLYLPAAPAAARQALEHLRDSIRA